VKPVLVAQASRHVTPAPCAGTHLGVPVVSKIRSQETASAAASLPMNGVSAM
jgi:hypothetical protein